MREAMGGGPDGLDGADRRLVPSIVLEAPIPKRSFGDKTSLHVISIYSDKQQHGGKIKALLKRPLFLTKPLMLGIGASKAGGVFLLQTPVCY